MIEIRDWKENQDHLNKEERKGIVIHLKGDNMKEGHLDLHRGTGADHHHIEELKEEGAGHVHHNKGNITETIIIETEMTQMKEEEKDSVTIINHGIENIDIIVIQEDDQQIH